MFPLYGMYHCFIYRWIFVYMLYLLYNNFRKTISVNNANFYLSFFIWALIFEIFMPFKFYKCDTKCWLNALGLYLHFFYLCFQCLYISLCSVVKIKLYERFVTSVYVNLDLIILTGIYHWKQNEWTDVDRFDPNFSRPLQVWFWNKNNQCFVSSKYTNTIR